MSNSNRVREITALAVAAGVESWKERAASEISAPPEAHVAALVEAVFIVSWDLIEEWHRERLLEQLATAWRGWVEECEGRPQNERGRDMSDWEWAVKIVRESK